MIRKPKERSFSFLTKTQIPQFSELQQACKRWSVAVSRERVDWCSVSLKGWSSSSLETLVSSLWSLKRDLNSPVEFHWWKSPVKSSSSGATFSLELRFSVSAESFQDSEISRNLTPETMTFSSCGSSDFLGTVWVKSASLEDGNWFSSFPRSLNWELHLPYPPKEDEWLRIPSAEEVLWQKLPNPSIPLVSFRARSLSFLQKRTLLQQLQYSLRFLSDSKAPVESAYQKLKFC